jgi:ABC-type nitrate/sulfonate/bicarbonate transport system substrate-binding protein
MNTKMYMLAVIVAVMLLPGCKTTGGTSLAAAPAAKPVPPGTTYAPRIEENAAYVAYVENMARRRGVTVRWVNKPSKRKVDQ